MMQFKYEDVAAKTLSPETRKALGAQIKADIDAWCVKEFTDEHRTHLGASIIGNDCSRAIWYSFRWVKFQIFSGRMLRLFQRGHDEEQKFIRYLRGIGCQVWEHEPAILNYHPESDSYWLTPEFQGSSDGMAVDVTGMIEHEKEAKNRGIERKQYRIYGVHGHYGGSQDGAGMLPYLPDLPMLMEFKTHNNKSFTSLEKSGVKISKPQHYAQMCSYGRYYRFKYALYCAVNKDNDENYFEVVDLDWNYGDENSKKASDIIFAELPPSKISLQPNFYKCLQCNFVDICHHGAPVEVNCRSCKYAEPIQNGEWQCNLFEQTIPSEFISKGCIKHISANIT